MAASSSSRGIVLKYCTKRKIEKPLAVNRNNFRAMVVSDRGRGAEVLVERLDQILNLGETDKNRLLRELRQLGLTEADLQEAAERSVAEVAKIAAPGNPRPCSLDDMLALLRAAFAGTRPIVETSR